MGTDLLELHFEETLNIDMTITASEETMKKLLSLSTRYMLAWHGTGLLLTKKENHYILRGNIGFHYEWFNGFLDLASDMEFVKFSMNIESPYTHMPEEIVYEQGDFWLIERVEESFFEEGSSEEHAFNQYKNLVLRKNLNSLEVDYHFTGSNMSIGSLHSILNRCHSFNVFEEEILKTQTQDDENYEVSVSYFQDADYITATIFLEDEKLFISYDGKISAPKSEKTLLRAFAKGVEDSQIPVFEERKEIIQNRETLPAMITYGDEVILDAVEVTVEYINSCSIYYTNQENRLELFTNDVRVNSNNEWVSPCSVCVNRMKKEIDGCSTCHFTQIGN